MSNKIYNQLISILVIFAVSIIILYFSRFFNGGKAMVIVEPRKHKMLKYVCENFDTNMPKDWDLYVFHGKSHKEYAQQAVSNIKSRKVYLLALDKDNLQVKEYNHLFKQIDFWNQVKAENILVFQTDAVLCSSSQYKIKDFMHFDYIGCGAYNRAYGNEKEVWGKNELNNQIKYNSFYGVGGLSFRKNSFQKQCIRKYSGINPDYPEDVFYSNCVEESIHKPRSANDLANFCTQNNFEEKSFGAHKTYIIKQSDAEPFYKFCPAARAIKKD